MSRAAEMTGRARDAVTIWVGYEERQTGSRMDAYKTVASRIGTSACWLRKFIAGRPDAKQPDWSVGWSILDQYDRVCTLIERDTERTLARARELRDEINAALEGTSEVVERSTATAAAGARGEEA
jgi:hypothetical protein